MPVYPRPALPRLQFAGRFFADPSTINNVTAYYDVETFRPNYQLRQDSQNLNGGYVPSSAAEPRVLCCVLFIRFLTSTSVSSLRSPPFVLASNWPCLLRLHAAGTFSRPS